METPQDAQATLDHLTAVRCRTLEPYRPLWYPLVVFGVITLVSAPLYVLAPAAAGAYWLVATIAGWFAISRHYATAGRKAGIGQPRGARRTWVYWIGVWVAIAVAASVGANLAGSAGAVVGLALVLACAYGWFAWLSRSPVLAAVAATIGADGAAVAASGVRDPYTVFMLVLGALLAGSGLYLHALDERAA